MRKISFLALSLILSCYTFNSCVKDDDNHAEATVAFIGSVSQLNYSTLDDEIDKSEPSETESETPDVEGDSSPGFDYTDMIIEAFDKLEVTGEKSQFSETAKVDNNSIAYAQYVCAVQATPIIQKKIDNISLDDIKQQIFKNNMDKMMELGYNKPEDIPVTKVIVQFYYYLSVNGADPLVFDKVY